MKFDTDPSRPACTPDRKDTANCSHPVELAQGTQCSGCHNAERIQSQHVSIFTIAAQFQYEVKSVTVGTDRKPVVQFDVLDAATKQPRDLENDPAYKDPASSLNVQLGWPSKEYTNDGTAPTTPAPGQPRSISVVRGGAFQAATVTKVSGQTGVYEVTSPVALPDGVTSATVFLDGHPVARGENLPVVNEVKTFGASGGDGDARRQVVAVENCNKCHGVLSAHGRNRNGTTQVCVVCHNPKATDWQKRQGTDATGEQSIDFKVLVHGIHSADISKDPMVVWGFNGANAAKGGAPGTPNEFPGEIPHGVANCVKCHAGTTYEPPLPAEALDTVVDTNNTPLDQSDDKTMGKTQAVCTSCHDQVHFTQCPWQNKGAKPAETTLVGHAISVVIIQVHKPQPVFDQDVAQPGLFQNHLGIHAMARPVTDENFRSPAPEERFRRPSDNQRMGIDVAGPYMGLHQVRLEKDTFSAYLLRRNRQFSQSAENHGSDIPIVAFHAADEDIGRFEGTPASCEIGEDHRAEDRHRGRAHQEFPPGQLPVEEVSRHRLRITTRHHFVLSSMSAGLPEIARRRRESSWVL